MGLAIAPALVSLMAGLVANALAWRAHGRSSLGRSRVD
jgi:hypothetical protein